MVWAAAIIWSEWRRSRTERDPQAHAPRRSRLARLRDGSLSLLLRSPFARFVNSGMLLILYRGRRSGRRLSTPVEYVRDGDRLLVLVGRPAEKQWWRNVQADPSVTLVLGGSRVEARAQVEVGAAAAADLARYVAARPRAAGVPAASGSVLVALDVI
jgi:deazaflavin-dependent oxidoreductase (nitroreductase family)